MLLLLRLPPYWILFFFFFLTVLLYDVHWPVLMFFFFEALSWMLGRASDGNAEAGLVALEIGCGLERFRFFD